MACRAVNAVRGFADGIRRKSSEMIDGTLTRCGPQCILIISAVSTERTKLMDQSDYCHMKEKVAKWEKATQEITNLTKLKSAIEREWNDAVSTGIPEVDLRIEPNDMTVMGCDLVFSCSDIGKKILDAIHQVIDTEVERLGENRSRID